MTFKEFDAMVLSTGRPSFVLGEQNFTFRSASKMAWMKWNKMILELQTPTESTEQEIEKTQTFVLKCAVPADRERLRTLLEYEGNDDLDEDEDNVASNADVAALLDKLLEYYSGKAPTNGNESLQTPSTTGLPVKSVSLNAVVQN